MCEGWVSPLMMASHVHINIFIKHADLVQPARGVAEQTSHDAGGSLESFRASLLDLFSLSIFFKCCKMTRSCFLGEVLRCIKAAH